MTYAKWDKEIDLNRLWEQYKRICTGCICIFGIEPFSSKIRLSNQKMYKYDWIYVKDKATNHLNCRKQPMKKTENISIFYKKQCYYNPQIVLKDVLNIRPSTTKRNNIEIYNSMDKVSKRTIPINYTYPNNLLYFNGCAGRKGESYHSTQKPVNLLKYLIKTYTKSNQVILDNFMGSGSTIIAALNLKRKVIGIEKEERFYKITQERIKKEGF